MLRAAQQRMHSDRRVAGLIIIKKELPLSRAIHDLELLLECSAQGDVENQIVFIPF